MTYPSFLFSNDQEAMMIRSSEVNQVSQPICPAPESSGARSKQSRRSFLHRSVLTGAAAGTAAVLATSRRAEARFFGGDRHAAGIFREIQGNENAHVAFIQGLLGPAAFPRPEYVNLNPRTVEEFAGMSRTFETVGANAYLGAFPVFNQSQILADAGSIAEIEARQAGVVSTLLGFPLNNNGAHFESPLTPPQAASMAMGFFADPEFVVSLANAIQSTPSDANDIAIFRFALSLEYLESTFYNLNVPLFFGHD
jgi:Ferritin-like domain